MLGNHSNKTSTVFFDQVAKHVLAQQAQAMPDLSGIIVLLPNHKVEQPLTEALERVSGRNDLTLPYMITLTDWAQSVPLPSTVIPDTCRAASLYQALRDRKWFADANLWGIANELMGLLDELTRHHVVLPQDEKDFLAKLEAAYQSKSGSSMQFEARVVHELWYAMNASGELDTARAYQERLAILAKQADFPLVVLLASELDTQEASFIEAYEKKASVKVFDLRDMMTREPDCAVLTALPTQWNGGGLSLRAQAAQLCDKFPQAALGQKLRLFEANSMEQEARAAEVQVQQWLAEGKKNIALVAQDRLVARRVRAMLERAGVQVHDESGWKFSTMAVSTVLMRWLDALQSDFYHQDLFDLLKSPYIFADLNAPQGKRAVHKLEQLVRKHGVVSHLDAFVDLAVGEPEVLDVLTRLQAAAKTMNKSTNTLSGWLEQLQESLTILGITDALVADAAGAELMEKIQTWQTELADEKARFSRTEWRHWLTQLLDVQTYCDPATESAVRLTHLAATRWRHFDAVLMMGCDSNHLPSVDKGSVWFNDAVRAALGLPTRDEYMALQRDTLLSLLAMNDNVVATWQSSKGGELVLLSPYFEMLRSLHDLAYGENLADGVLATLLKNAKLSDTSAPLPVKAIMPSPVAMPALVPETVSASGYNSLVGCPYQFYARHMLHLNEMDEVREGVEKRDYGQWVHEILHRFHIQFPVVKRKSKIDLIQIMTEISKEVFGPIVQRDYLARAWLMRWLDSIPSYLDAQYKNEDEGWLYKGGEVPFEMPVAADLKLRGRIDRIDTHTSGKTRVLDYKMMDITRLRHKLKVAGEDVQLPCYAHVVDADEAAFISIDKDRVGNVPPPQDLPTLAHDNVERLVQLFGQMKGGAAMPAHGVDEACTYCEMRGLCRKAEWRNNSREYGVTV